MIYRISVTFLSLIALFVAYQIYDIYSLKTGAYAIEEGKSIGNPQGDIIITEFLDYACPHCRAIAPVIDQAVAQDGNVVLLPRPIASLNEEGTIAAYTAYAAAKHGLFLEAHKYLIENPVPPADNFIQDMALILGLSDEEFKTAIDDPKLVDKVRKDMRLLQAMGVGQIPAFLIKHKPSGEEILFFPSSAETTPQRFLDIFNTLRESS